MGNQTNIQTKKQTGKTPRQMVKATLIRQEQRNSKLTLTKRIKKEKMKRRTKKKKKKRKNREIKPINKPTKETNAKNQSSKNTKPNTWKKLQCNKHLLQKQEKIK